MRVMGIVRVGDVSIESTHWLDMSRKSGNFDMLRR
jgi:hypothetical protein